MTTKPGKNVVTSDDDPNILVGRVLNGNYRLAEVIDVGGMGFVFRATRIGTNRQFAVKMLKPSMARDIDIAKRFQREIDVMGILDHPNIVSIVDSGRDASGFVYFVMEYLSGTTFAEALSELSLAEIVDVFRQVCNALIEAHASEVIHRDLKLENIIVRRLHDRRLHTTVLDFGVARPLNMRFSEALTRAGEVPGTPSIVAPELVDNYTPTPQSDLYSLGCVMFSAVAGQPPFRGKNEFELVNAHKTQEIPNLSEIVADVPEPLLELIYALMQKDPKRRPESAIAVRDRIEAIQNLHFAGQSGVYVPPDVTIDSLDVEQGDGAQTEEKSRERMIAPTSIVSLLIVLVMILALILIYLAYYFLIVSPNPG